MWLWGLITAVGIVVAIAATAAITYGLTRFTTTPSATNPTPAAPAAPTFTAAQQSDAKQVVCQEFDVSSRGMDTQGGVRMGGSPNLPLLLRMLSGTLSVQQALTPAVPDDVAQLAHRVVSTNLDLINAAMGQASIGEVQTATNFSNDAVYALADACGLRR